MKKIAVFLTFCLFFNALQAQQTPKYQRAKINFLPGKDFQPQMQKLASLGIETDHGDLKWGKSFTTDLAESEILTARQAGFEVEILIDDVSKWYVEHAKDPASYERGGDCVGGSQTVDYQTPANYQGGSLNGYYTLAEMYAELDEMRAKYPNLISARQVTSETLVTHEGRKQYWVKISDNPDADEAEPEILYNAMHHAREMNSSSQMIFFMWYLLENYAQNPEVQYIVNNLELHFIPCVNPDGVIFNETTNPTGGGMWRKNRRANADGTFGVDLNRNYGWEWGFDNNGSSPNPGSETYRGPAAFSEPETQMMRDFTAAHDFVISLNYHSFSNLLIYPWGFSDELAEPTFLELSKILTRENHYKTGTATETVGYQVNGTTDDWLYGNNGTFAMTPEVGPASWGFWPPEAEILGLNKANMWQNLSAALCLLKFGQVTDESPNNILTTTFDLPFSLTRYGFQDGPLTVSLSPVSANIASTGSPKSFTINQFENVADKFSVNLSPGIQNGESVKMLLKLDNGAISWTDTLRKVYGAGGLAQTIFSDPISNAQKWNREMWNVTPQTFVTSPASFADSPAGDYKDNNVNTITLKNPVEIPASATSAALRFWAKWSIEPDFDYCQVQVSSDNNNWTPMCGNHTNAGTNGQPAGEPLYDDFQNDWVEECVDLTDFVGQQVWVRFQMVSDNGLSYDGYYFDDLKIEFTGDVSGTENLLSGEDFIVSQNSPNPVVNGRTNIAWENPAKVSGEAKLLVFNVLGELKLETPLNLNGAAKVEIETVGWPAGTYFYRVSTLLGDSGLFKMVIAD